jgi:EAL domain-containing protein (putative c-di-GMP-specific phosphodiesterase class I)
VIDRPDTLETLTTLIKKHEIRPEQLIFEITETAAVSNLEQAQKVMIEIRKLGCEFALDDFGVGFGSFNYMRELPVDIVKIDGIFIKDLDQNEADQLFVKALVDVANGLGKKTIAEFVENKASLNLLREYGVTHAQGYYIGKPHSELLTDHHWQEEAEIEPVIMVAETAE